MGEQGSLQVADGHVADVATRVTAHASHSLGGEEEGRRGKERGRGGKGRVSINTANMDRLVTHHTYLSVYFTSVDTQMYMTTHKLTSPPSLIPTLPLPPHLQQGAPSSVPQLTGTAGLLVCLRKVQGGQRHILADSRSLRRST